MLRSVPINHMQLALPDFCVVKAQIMKVWLRNHITKVVVLHGSKAVCCIFWFKELVICS